MGSFHPLLWITGILWWISLFTWGVLPTIITTIVIGAILGIITYIKENTRV